MASSKKYAITFDLSSKCSAFAFGKDGSLLKYGKWINKNYDKGVKDHGNSLLKFSAWVSRSIRGCERTPEIVLIEAPFFNRNVLTFGILSKFLGVAEREIRRLLPGVEIRMVNASTVKKALNVEKGSDHTARKRNMVKKINRMLGLNLRFHKSNKTLSDDDVADAIAVLLYYFKTEA